MPKKIYIAGPMRGRKFYNFPAFDAAEERLRRLGYDVVNPAYLDRMRGIQPESFPEDWDWSQVPEGFNLKEVALTCLRLVSECDGVLLLDGYLQSSGALAELAFARWTRIPSSLEISGDPMLMYFFGSPT